MKGLSLIVGACITFIVVGARPGSAQGGCGSASIAYFLEHPGPTAIFRGKATAVKKVPPSLTWPRDRREIATMTVTTVWKGSVPAQTTLYAFIGDTVRPGMQVDSEYIVLAGVLSPEGRPWFGLPWTGEPALGANGMGCDIKPMDSPFIAKFIGDAIGYPPK